MNSIESAPILPNTKVLVRYDLDVPIENGKILEEFRLEAGLQTLKYIIRKGGIPIILGHIGKPAGKFDKKLSTDQLRPWFNEHLEKDSFILLENLRFDSREESNNEAFAKELATLGELYVNESFSTSHREHASVVGLPKFLPAYAGFRLVQEVTTLEKVRSDPKRPLTALVGGAKLESKLPVVKKFLDIADHVLLGGKIGIEWAKQGRTEVYENLVLPFGYVDGGKDIDSKTIEHFCSILADSETVVWAGPIGMYEDSKYIMGTKELGKTLAKSIKAEKCFAVVGGGDTIAALDKCELLGSMSFVSTGGGAMLDFLANGVLPGTRALESVGSII